MVQTGILKQKRLFEYTFSVQITDTGFLLGIGFVWLHTSCVISSNFLFLEAN